MGANERREGEADGWGCGGSGFGAGAFGLQVRDASFQHGGFPGERSATCHTKTPAVVGVSDGGGYEDQSLVHRRTVPPALEPADLRWAGGAPEDQAFGGNRPKLLGPYNDARGYPPRLVDRFSSPRIR